MRLLLLLAAAACLGAGAVCGLARTGVLPRTTTATDSGLSLGRRRVAASASVGGEKDDNHEELLAATEESVPGDPTAADATAAIAAAGLRQSSLVSGDNHADGSPIIHNLVGDGKAAATGAAAVAANLDAAVNQSGAGRAVDCNGSPQALQPLVVDDNYHQNRTKRAGGSIMTDDSPPRRLGHGGLGGRAPPVPRGEGDASVGGRKYGGSRWGSGGRGGEMGSEEDRGDGNNGDEESLSRRLLLPSDEDDGGGGICRPLKVEGLDNCPELNNAVVENLLATKADMLRQVSKEGRSVGGDGDDSCVRDR